MALISALCRHLLFGAELTATDEVAAGTRSNALLLTVGAL